VLDLGRVTLCSVDTRTPLLAIQAMQRSMQGIRFGDAILFAHADAGLVDHAARLGIRVIDPGELNSINAYSEFMLKELGRHVENDFALIVQWDGFVVHPEIWTNEFLKYDYIGAPWRDGIGDDRVGNGGFSLRSKKLLNALGATDIATTHPEDLCICKVNRSRLEMNYGVRFASVDIATRFSYEHVRITDPTFGFHGVFNLHEALSASDMLAMIKTMTVDMAFSAGMRSLAKALVYEGQYEAARILLHMRIRNGDRKWRTISLLLRLWIRRVLAVPPKKLRS
jgi:hypothetical protein